MEKILLLLLLSPPLGSVICDKNLLLLTKLLSKIDAGGKLCMFLRGTFEITLSKNAEVGFISGNDSRKKAGNSLKNHA